MTVHERFAPSPTGPLHLGHAFSALTAHDAATAAGGRFSLRIEDIDQSRARAEWIDLIYEDLAWLGLDWDQPVLVQSTRLPAYQDALVYLAARGLLYGCTCNRRDIQAALSAPQEGAPLPTGADGLIYPGTCRANRVTPQDLSASRSGRWALRLDLAEALARTGARLSPKSAHLPAATPKPFRSRKTRFSQTLATRCWRAGIWTRPTIFRWFSTMRFRASPM